MSPHLLELFSPVVLPAGHQLGMGRLKAAVNGVIAGVSQDDGGRPIYRVSFTTNGKERSTWLTSADAHAFHERAGAPVGIPETRRRRLVRG